MHTSYNDYIIHFMLGNERPELKEYTLGDPKTDQMTALLVRIDCNTRSRLVSQAFRMIDRAQFVPLGCDLSLAHKDECIDLKENGATISMPSLSALMVDCLGLTGREKVLEIGTGSGYLAAILSLCAQEVYTVEYNEKLMQHAGERLNEFGCKNVHVFCGDGALGLSEHAPYDGIIVTAGANSVVPPSLVEQLALDGRLVIPVGRDPIHQQLVRGLRYPQGLLAGQVEAVSFHSLMSREEGGWTNDMISKAGAFKRMLFLQSAAQQGLSEEDVIRDKARETGVSIESFNLDNYLLGCVFPETIWDGFDEWLVMSEAIEKKA